MAEFYVAKELHMTLGDLRSKMTYEELWLWCAYFGVINDEQADQMKKAQSRRR